METRPFIVSFSLKSHEQSQAFRDALARFAPNWIGISETLLAFTAPSELRAQDVWDALAPHVANQEVLFVCEVGRNRAASNPELRNLFASL